MVVMARHNPWSHRIDYSKAIAADQAKIARLEMLVSLKAWIPDVSSPGWGRSSAPFGFVVYHRRDIGYALGFTDEQMDAAIYDSCVHHNHDYLGAVEWARYEAAAKTSSYSARRDLNVWGKIENLIGFVRTEAEVRKELAHARTCLSRHLRNQAKYGDK